MRIQVFWRGLAGRLLLAGLAGLGVLSPVLVRDGWPYNHDGLRPLIRMAEVVGQWRAGHVLPIWSSVGQQAYGSPAPILYHKLFSAVGAVLLLLTGAPKAALCLTLLLFMVAGFLGVGLAIRLLAGRPVPAIEAVCGWVLLSCNYATTDWLVRGAAAEFAALCLLPLLFAWCVLLLGGRCSRWIGPLMALLWLTHSGIALFCALPLGLTVGLALLRDRRRLGAAIRPLGQAVALFGLLLLPFGLAALPMLAFADTPFLVLHARPGLTHKAFDRLFFDTVWQWGGAWDGMTIAVDPLLLATALALPVVIAVRPGLRWPAALMLLTALAVLGLQTRTALPLYDAVPGLAYIQFTWRLLCFLSVALSIGLGIVLLALSGSRSARVRAATMPVLVCVAFVSALGRPRAPGAAEPRFDAATVALAGRGVATSGLSMEAPEYLPKVPGGPQEFGVLWQAARRSGLCTATWAQDPGREADSVRFGNGCAADATVALPVFLAPGMRAFAGGVPLAMTRGCDDPRPRVRAGTAREIVLRMPRILQALRDWWRGRAGYGRCGG